MGQDLLLSHHNKTNGGNVYFIGRVGSGWIILILCNSHLKINYEVTNMLLDILLLKCFGLEHK